MMNRTLPLLLLFILAFACGKTWSDSVDLIYEVKQGQYEKVKQLIQSGVDVNVSAPDPQGWTAMHFASDAAMADLLLAHGADIHKDSRLGTPLTNAVSNENIEMVDWLLAHGADIEKKSQHNGYSAASLAFRKNNKKIGQLLLQKILEKRGILAEKASAYRIATSFGRDIYPWDFAINIDCLDDVNSSKKGGRCDINKSTHPIQYLVRYIARQVYLDYIDRHNIKATQKELMSILAFKEKLDKWQDFKQYETKWIIKGLEKRIGNSQTIEEERSYFEKRKQELMVREERDKERREYRKKRSEESKEFRQQKAKREEADVIAWKFTKLLHDTYGGAILSNKFAGAVPAGAMASLLHDYEKGGQLSLFDKVISKAFWSVVDKKPRRQIKSTKQDLAPYWEKPISRSASATLDEGWMAGKYDNPIPDPLGRYDNRRRFSIVYNPIPDPQGRYEFKISLGILGSHPCDRQIGMGGVQNNAIHITTKPSPKQNPVKSPKKCSQMEIILPFQEDAGLAIIDMDDITYSYRLDEKEIFGKVDVPYRGDEPYKLRGVGVKLMILDLPK